MPTSKWFRLPSWSAHPGARRQVILALGVSLAVGLLPQYAPDAAADDKGRTRPEVQDLGKPVSGTSLKGERRRANPAEKARVDRAAAVDWPKPGSDAVSLGSAGRTAKAEGLPLEIGPPKQRTRSRPDTPDAVKVDVVGRKRTKAAGVDGVLLTVADAGKAARAGRAAGPEAVRVTLDYSGFAEAYGAGYGSRLRLVRLPQCALTTPQKRGCATPRELPTANDTAAKTLSADVPVTARGARSAPTVLAATAGASGDQGSFGSTPLAPSAEWSVSNSSGAFNWSYPLRTPPAPGGLVPGVTLGYNSQSVDGQTAATNNQGSWIGQGFGYEPGFIERRYKPCADDGQSKTNGDQCWAYDNATIQLAGGSSGELIKDDESGEWRISGDDNSKVEKLTGASNGDDNGEHWRVTTTDGTQYYFGLDNLPGYTSGKEQTGSTWTVPVYGDDSGEPCYDATLANAHCKQAWRWNLDYVVDPHDNAMSYFYGKETNYYTQGLKTDENGKAYTRGGYLKRIDYGQRDGKVYSTPAAGRMVFDTDERCLAAAADCQPGDLTDATAGRWPDVPWDLNCKADTKCKGQNSPTFWTRKKLSKVTTQIRYGDGYADVDSWTLGHLFTDNGDSSKSLWLNTIKQTGHAGSGTAETPAVELLGQQLPNRVDKPGDNIQAMNRFRISGVDNGSGGQLDILYREAECKASSLPDADSPKKACYPVKWNPPGAEDPITDWFHKYLVERVVEDDVTADTPDNVSEYDYQGDAGWKKARADGITKSEYRTHSDWRGYGKVRVTKSDGTVSSANQRTEHVFLRGLGGEVTDSTGTKHADEEELSGQELETITYDGGFATDKIVSKSISTTWSRATATRVKDWGTRKAYYVRPQTTRTYTALPDNKWQEVAATTRYDAATGRAVETDDYGKIGDSGDNQCARTEFADNKAKNIYDLVSRAEKVAVTCDAKPDRKTQVISDELTFYDGKGLGEAPTKGDATKVQRLSKHDGTTPTYQTVSEATPADFDRFGRPLKAKDAKGIETKFAYTETDGLTTKQTETNPLGWQVSTEYVRSWGVPAAQIDMNGKRSDLGYDALGRLTSVWLPDRSRDKDFTPSIKYSYLIRKTASTAVKTERIENNGTSYGTEYTIYDGLLRPRQQQSEGPNGGRIVADTHRDGLGNVIETASDYYTTGAPTATIFKPGGEVDGQTTTRYDGAGRKTAEIFKVADEEKWRTTYAYDGDRVHVDPPSGTAPTTTLTDGRGRTTEIRRYKGDKPAPTGTSADYEATSYTYTPAGQLKSVEDSAGNTWSYGYDQRGRKTSATDPDTGKSTYTYDSLDRLVSTTDMRGKSTSTKYDELGRPASTWEGEPDKGTQLTATTYDHVAKGQTYGTYKYENGKVQTSTLNVQLDELYQPTLTKVNLGGDTASELAGTYEFGTQYNPDGTVQSQSIPAAGGLGSETLTYTYDALQRPTQLLSTLDGKRQGAYVGQASYAPTSQLQQLELGTVGGSDGKKTWLTYEYERGTDRLKNSSVDVSGVDAVTYDADYTYDASGNVTSIADTPQGGQADVQCFRYDWQRRLKAAWATSNSSDGAAGSGKQDKACASDPSATTLGGPGAYWQDFDYDASGNRSKQVLYGVSGKPDVTRTYTYGKDADGNGGPHTLTKVVTDTPASSRGPAIKAQDTFAYDAAGNTRQRVLNGTTQDLSWNAEGKLTKSAKPDTEATAFSYDAGGNRLLRKEPGEQTLYLPGMELSLNTATRKVEATRYYGFGGRTVAMRTPNGVQFLAGDHHSTSLAAVDAASGQVTRRRMDPFGNARDTGSVEPWVDDKGFLGKSVDATTGLTHIGAREYEPENGRFVSADPLIDFTDPQQINGYAYANNSPVTLSDPTGEKPDDCIYAGVTCRLKDNGGWEVKPTKTYYRYYQLDKTPAQRKAIVARTRADIQQSRAVLAAKELGKIIQDELGITDALDCFSTGSLGSCGATILNVVTSAIGAKIGQLTKKYLLNWRKGVALGKRIWGLLGQLKDSVGKWRTLDKRADKLEDAAEKSSCVSNSFTPATRVLMADGSTKAIRDVDVGDKVLATDPKTGKTKVETVTAEIKGKGAKRLVKITIDTDGKKGTKTASVTATDGHPFWVPELGEWIDATNLSSGQWLRTSAGTHVQITAVARWTQSATVHNLTVADLHTYYVVAGARPVLVHNCNDGYADVYFDDVEGHASISVTHGDTTMHTEAGSQKGSNSVPGVRTRSHSPGTIVVRVPLPDARNAQRAQYAMEDVNLGPHDNDTNNCVTYCARILKAGGVGVPANDSQNIAGWLLGSSHKQRRL
ncbi:polymorphic toxin-type HINT domain-containing protein [Streptomyces sp. NRRL B-1347]|uniref:polymorphic toxin-type HINT domain-containing protein n=1 Tax=Streptomyces sp. NRRL B-1347 TaxID=1476877 RepID=UPI00068CC1F0|nr:polymorphic toxin-type HINT domain-containing protein [Streptomyces sp. NRRL B-1347]